MCCRQFTCDCRALFTEHAHAHAQSGRGGRKGRGRENGGEQTPSWQMDIVYSVLNGKTGVVAGINPSSNQSLIIIHEKKCVPQYFIFVVLRSNMLALANLHDARNAVFYDGVGGYTHNRTMKIRDTCAPQQKFE